MKNKRGWLKIVEAFVAILLITMVALIVIERQQIHTEDISEKVYSIESDIMYEILVNHMDAIKKDELNFSELNDIIDTKTPNYLQCKGIICEIDEDCSIDNIVPQQVLDKDKDIYVQVMPIIKEEKKLKIACWI